MLGTTRCGIFKLMESVDNGFANELVELCENRD